MNQPEDKRRQLQYQMSAMAGLAGQIAGLTILLIFGAVFGGLWLDKIFNTNHIILIILVLGAGPLSIYLTFKLALRAVGKVNPSAKASEAKSQPEEDYTGE
jgi:F0F1-type ATP synthase assembly protein I